MRSLISVALLAVALAACSSGGDNSTVADDPTSTETAPESLTTTEPEPEPAGESADCLVTASKWADRMADHVIDAATTAPAFGETLNLGNLDDPTSEIKVLCSDKLAEPVLNGNAKIAKANFELSLCGFSGGCPGSRGT